MIHTIKIGIVCPHWKICVYPIRLKLPIDHGIGDIEANRLKSRSEAYKCCQTYHEHQQRAPHHSLDHLEFSKAAGKAELCCSRSLSAKKLNPAGQILRQFR